MTFVMSCLFLVSFVWCLEKAVLRDCVISWMSSPIFFINCNFGFTIIAQVNK